MTEASLYLSSSAISEQRLWWSLCAFFLEFQQNSRTATMMASERPQRRTTKTPPIFLTLSGLALESLLLSCLVQTSPVFFHHLLYSIWIVPFSCNSRMARESGSRQADPLDVPIP